MNKIWTEENLNKAIELHNLGVKRPKIAEALGVPTQTVKIRLDYMIRKGLLQSNRTVVDIESDIQLLDYIRTYPAKDSCPFPYRTLILNKYQSWSAALEAASLPPNIGGKFDKTKPTILYLLDFGEFKKFGVTQQTIQHRFSGAPKFQVLDQAVLNLYDALEDEALIKAGVADRAFQPNLPWFARNGKTECFIGNETKLEDLL